MMIADGDGQSFHPVADILSRLTITHRNRGSQNTASVAGVFNLDHLPRSHSARRNQ